MAPPTEQSQRVTLAVLGSKMDSIADDLKEFITEQKTCNKDTDGRLKDLESARVSFGSFKATVTWVGVTVGGAILLFMVAIATRQATVTFP